MNAFLTSHGAQLLETGLAVVTIAAVRTAARLATRATVRRTGTKAGEAREVGRIIDLLLALVGAIVLTAIWGVKQSELLIFATSVITVLGIGLFAEMSILSNITAFLVLFFQHPVKIGDRISLHDGERAIEGTLVDLTYFFAHIRTDTRTKVTVPNAVLLKTAFTIVDADPS